jgi:multidrug efflux pump subunit AcrA (membrane-fusion protein)
MKSATSLYILISTLALAGQTQTPSAPVQVAQVVEQRVASTVELVGTVMPKRRSIVASGADGLVVALGEIEEHGGIVGVKREIQEGDEIKSGEVLAQLRTRTLRIQEEAAHSALEASRQELNELKAGSRPEEIERAKAAMAVADAKAKMAQAKHQRLERLVARNAASGEDVDEALGLFVMAQEDVAKLKADYDLAKLGPRVEKIKQAEARIETASAEVRRIQDEVEKRTVRAPFDGYVVAKLTEVGQWLSTNSPVFEIVELKEVEIQLMVPERHITQVRQGMTVNTRVEALGDQVFTGKVSKIVRQADTKSRLFPVMIRVTNQVDSNNQPLLQAGMFAVARLPLGARHAAKLVPKDALVLQAGKSIVFVVEQNDNGAKVASIPVKPGSAHEDLVEVEGNLKPGQRVVVRGNERLADGQNVQIDSRPETANGSNPEP